MERGETIASDVDTDYIIQNPRTVLKHRFRDFFGMPKFIDGEHTDSEHGSWCMSILSNKRFLILFRLF